MVTLAFSVRVNGSLRKLYSGPFFQNALCICHGTKSNLVEFQILLVDSQIGVSTSRKFNPGELGIALRSEI